MLSRAAGQKANWNHGVAAGCSIPKPASGACPEFAGFSDGSMHRRRAQEVLTAPIRHGTLRCFEPRMSPVAVSMQKDIVVVHTSDLHVDHDYTARIHGGDGTAGLACVLQAATGIGADLVLLAGDTFESHRVPPYVLERAASVIAAAALPVVLLPGNHDPAIPEGIYRNGALSGAGNLHVLGVTH